MSSVGERVRLRRSRDDTRARDEQRDLAELAPASLLEEKQEECTDKQQQQEQTTAADDELAVSTVPFVVVFMIAIPAYVCAWAIDFARTVTG